MWITETAIRKTQNAKRILPTQAGAWPPGQCQNKGKAPASYPPNIPTNPISSNQNPNFDEYNFAHNMGIDPALMAVLTLTVFLFAITYFSVVIFKRKRISGLLQLWSATLLGLVFWGMDGKLILP